MLWHVTLWNFFKFFFLSYIIVNIYCFLQWSLRSGWSGIGMDVRDRMARGQTKDRQYQFSDVKRKPALPDLAHPFKASHSPRPVYRKLLKLCLFWKIPTSNYPRWRFPPCNKSLQDPSFQLPNFHYSSVLHITSLIHKITSYRVKSLLGQISFTNREGRARSTAGLCIQ